ncbi:MAG: hypothetical protein HND50_20955 [Calditrichaeota bacterium]|nr:hypothetical protein [Calditrichota bacterium]
MQLGSIINSNKFFKIFPPVFVILFISSCSFQKSNKKNIIRQGEAGSLQLSATASHDTITSPHLEDLRFYITLKNKYPFPVQSLKYLSFLECNVLKDGKYFHTVSSPIEPVKELTPMWQEIFPADTSITITVFVDIEKIARKKGHKKHTGRYSIQGV